MNERTPLAPNAQFFRNAPQAIRDRAERNVKIKNAFKKIGKSMGFGALVIGGFGVMFSGLFIDDSEPIKESLIVYGLSVGLITGAGALVGLLVSLTQIGVGDITVTEQELNEAIAKLMPPPPPRPEP